MNRKSVSRIKSTLGPDLAVLIEQGAPAAFESLQEEIRAVSSEDLIPINLDISRAARRGLVVAERIKPLLKAMAAIGDLDMRKIEQLPMYALALLYAHDQAEKPEEGTIPLGKLVAEATPLRADLLVTAEYLAHFGLVSRRRVAAIRRGQGHADTADDLLALGVLLGDIWKDIEHKVVVTRAQVDRAIPLSAQLHKAIGVRESDADPLVEPTNARHVRAQAYSLFMAAYDECRRGVSHLRWHQRDAGRIVPSLYPRRNARTKPDEADAADDLVDPGSITDPEVDPTPPSERIAETAADALVRG